MELVCFCSVLCLLCLCALLFICALWSPAGKGLTSWLLFVVSAVSLSLPFGILGQVWCLIVSIPDLCTLTYFVMTNISLLLHTSGLNIKLKSQFDGTLYYFFFNFQTRIVTSSNNT